MSISKNFIIHVDTAGILGSVNPGNAVGNPMSVDQYCKLDSSANPIAGTTEFNIPTKGITQVTIALQNSVDNGASMTFYSFWGIGGQPMVGGIMMSEAWMMLDCISEAIFSEVFQLYFTLKSGSQTVYCRIDPVLKGGQGGG